MRRPVVFAAALALVLGCVDIPTETRPEVIVALFDPSKGEVPEPNDLALVDGKVAIPVYDNLSSTENELKQSLNGRDGFSLGSSMTVRFSGALSGATLSTDSVLALDLGLLGEGAAPQRAEFHLRYDDCNHSIEIASPTGLSPGHTYLFAVRGGEKTHPAEPDAFRVKGKNGEPVVPSPAFHFLKAGKDLREHAYAFPGATLAERAALAEQLEAVRQRYEPLIQILEANGLPRRDVAILWTVTAQTGGEALADPERQAIPMPNDLLRNATTGKVELPIDPAEPEVQQELKRGLNDLDGFSTTGAFTVEFTRPLKFDDFAQKRLVRLYRADTLEEKTDLTVNLWPDGVRMSIEPQTPLLPDTHYVVVVAQLRDTATNTVTGMPLTQLLKLKHPLVADGQSQIASVCLETAQKLEPLRQQIQPVLDHIEGELPRDQIAAVWTFKTQDILSRIQALYETPYVKDLPLEVTIEKDQTPIEALMPLFQVKKILQGKMTTWDYLDPVTTAFRPNGQGELRQIDFVMTIPNVPKSKKVPVVVFGHGLLTERRLGLFIADKLAESGFAMMAIDFPLHGERSVCSADSDCEGGAVCAADRTCRKGGQKADFARISAIKFGDTSINFPSFGGWGKGTPICTGAKYVDLEHMVAARDHLRQTLVDISAQVRLLRKMDWTGATGGWSFDPEKVYYVGISLGGITGADMSAVDPHFKRMLLNVGGGGIIELLEDSATLGAVMKQGLKDKGITPERGVPEYETFRNAGHWIVDEVDPVNLIPYGNAAPRPYVDAETGEEKVMAPKALRLQMANGDAVVPNSATLRMLKASRLDKDTHFRAFDLATHAFLADPAEVPAHYQGLDDMAAFLKGEP